MPQEPGPGQAPTPRDGGDRDLQEGGDLLIGQAAEKPQLDDLRLPRVDLGQALQRLVESEEVDASGLRAGDRGVEGFDEGDVAGVAAAVLRLPAPGVVDLIVTDLAVIEVQPDGLLLTEVAPGVEPDLVASQTEPELRRSPDLREMEL